MLLQACNQEFFGKGRSHEMGALQSMFYVPHTKKGSAAKKLALFW